MTLDAKIAETVAALQALSTLRSEIDRAAELILSTLNSGGKLLICGNGGSAAEAAHFATELTGRFAKNRRSLPAIALSSDGSLLSCIGNDFGFDTIFSRQIEGLGRPGDLVVVLSSSGKSANIIAALHVARSQGIPSIALLGRGGGDAKGGASVDLIVPGEAGAAAQEVHLALIHYFCALVDLNEERENRHDPALLQVQL